MRLAGGWLLWVPALFLLISATAFGQQPLGSKLPGIGKITSPGSGQQAFAGSVLSIDQQHHVLNISASPGNGAEIFPIQKKVKVSSVGGRKLKLAALTPGTNVIVYYQEKDGRRAVSQIVVLSSRTPAAKKKSPVSS
ncbi:MAG: hypothetical protein ACRD10_00285 [Terriglobia bacterium]